MDKLTFSTPIDAARERVWRVMLDDATYREWTSEFAEGSHAVTDWSEGSKALFRSSSSGDAMASRIAAHRPNEFLSLEHLGIVKAGAEDTSAPESHGWAGAHENYTLTDNGRGVTLTIEIDVVPEHRAWFEQTWPKALTRLKAICERV